MNLVETSLVVFSVSAVVDAVWAKYITTAASGKAFSAAIWSSLIVACGSFVTVQYVANRWMILPAIAGGFVGTYLMMKFGTKKIDN